MRCFASLNMSNFLPLILTRPFILRAKPEGSP